MSDLIDFVNFNNTTKLEYSKFISFHMFGKVNKTLWNTKNLTFYSNFRGQK